MVPNTPMLERVRTIVLDGIADQDLGYYYYHYLTPNNCPKAEGSQSLPPCEQIIGQTLVKICSSL